MTKTMTTALEFALPCLLVIAFAAPLLIEWSRARNTGTDADEDDSWF